jgi:hypothetical protein
MYMNMDSTPSPTYETSDIALASYLVCSGITLQRIDHQNPRRCIFVFDSIKPELVSKFAEGNAIVNALAFYNAYQNLKRKLFRGELWD